MKVGGRNNLFIILCSTLLFAGSGVNSLSYDYTANTECLIKPQKPQYSGGIIANPEFDDGLSGWSNFGIAKIQRRESQGNKFIVVYNRSQPYDSVSQNLYLQKDHIYTFSAWIRVSRGNKVAVTATFKTTSGYKHAGSIFAKSHCWSFLKGGLTVDSSGTSELYFESKDTSVEIWIDSISLQPFTQSQWKSHQHHSIQEMRKRNVRIKVVDSQGRTLPNATFTIRQKSSTFPFGCAINNNILTNTAYQNWFTSRGFTVTTFENEMKWYANEPTQNHEVYSDADAMLQLAKQHKIAVRGHNVFWDDPKYQPYWLDSLSHQQLVQAVWKRYASIMPRYRGQLAAWDVVNENLHNNYFESKLGRNASAVFYRWAFRADPRTTMFLNEYNTIESPGDARVSPIRYIEKVREILGFPGNGNGKLGIGVEAHFGNGAPNLGYVRSAIDALAATGLPVWITELDVKNGPNQANYLEQYLRELHSHPGIKGIVMWSAWRPQGCWQMCLTDNNFQNLPTGQVVDNLLREWGFQNHQNYNQNHHNDHNQNNDNVLRANSDASGFFEASLFHGDYQLNIVHPNVDNNKNLYHSSLSHSFRVEPSTTVIQLHS